MPLLAAVNFADPLLWTVMIGWIFTVVLHEFAHGLVGYLGGDYTVRERGGLTLNPLQYVDPLTSLILPVVFLLMGGVPLPGGATFVRRELLRSRGWSSAVSLAGPAMNFILFLALLLPFHPSIGWIHPGDDPDQWTNVQMFLAALGQLQIVAVVINLIPVPPLDGFGVISPYLDPQTRQKLMTPPVGTALMLGVFLLLWQVPAFWHQVFRFSHEFLLKLGFDYDTREFIRMSYNRCLFGSFN
jgi:Zn-dependent protease